MLKHINLLLPHYIVMPCITFIAITQLIGQGSGHMDVLIGLQLLLLLSSPAGLIGRGW